MVVWVVVLVLAGSGCGVERPTGVEVTIAVAPDGGGLPRFEVRFANRGERPATIILPQDGSTRRPTERGVGVSSGR